MATAGVADDCVGIVSSEPADLTHWVVDRPFSVALSGSNVTIVPYVGQIAFNGNNYSDGGEVRLLQARAAGYCLVWHRREARKGGLLLVMCSCLSLCHVVSERND